MKNLCNSAMLKEITPVIDSIYYRESALPSAVFLPRLKYVDFMPFEAVLMPEFFNKLISFVKCVKEADFFMVSIAPAIEDHVRDFTSGGYFKFDISDSAEEYLSALHHYPKESRADALAFHASQILFSSKSARWAALADRDSDLVIWGFEEEFIQLTFKNVFNEQIFSDVIRAAEYAYSEARLSDDARMLILNYPN